MRKWVRNLLLSRSFWLFLLRASQVMKTRGPFHLHGFGKAYSTVPVEHSFPASSHQLLGGLGAILVRMTASWSGFLIPGLVTEVVPDLPISPWSPTFPTLLPGWAFLRLMVAPLGTCPSNLPNDFISNYFMVWKVTPLKIQRGFCLSALPTA